MISSQFIWSRGCALMKVPGLYDPEPRYEYVCADKFMFQAGDEYEHNKHSLQHICNTIRYLIYEK
jgi:hypothetical protein